MMENKVKIIHLYDTTAIAKNWHFFVEGMEKILEYVPCEYNVDYLYNMLMSGVWSMYIVFIDDKYVGFYSCTQHQQHPHSPKNLIITQCFLKPGVPKDTFGLILEECVKLAKTLQCKRHIGYSYRNGMERRLKEYGYKVGVIEFYKEVDNV